MDNRGGAASPAPWSMPPDQCVIIPLPGTLCGRERGGTEIAATGLAERRQVVEVVIQREVMEYRIVSGPCACRRAQRSTFPAGIKAPVQYGPSVSAFAVYMTQYQLLPYQRTAEVLKELAGLAISPDPLQRAVRVTAAAWRRQSPRLATHFVAAPVAHADETSRRVNGALCTGCRCSALTGLRLPSLIRPYSTFMVSLTATVKNTG